MTGKLARVPLSLLRVHAEIAPRTCGGGGDGGDCYSLVARTCASELRRFLIVRVPKQIAYAFFFHFSSASFFAIENSSQNYKHCIRARVSNIKILLAFFKLKTFLYFAVINSGDASEQKRTQKKMTRCDLTSFVFGGTTLLLILLLGGSSAAYARSFGDDDRLIAPAAAAAAAAAAEFAPSSFASSPLLYENERLYRAVAAKRQGAFVVVYTTLAHTNLIDFLFFQQRSLNQ